GGVARRGGGRRGAGGGGGPVVGGGSLGRGRNTTGEAVRLAAAARPAVTLEAFTRLPAVSEVLGRGATKASVRLEGGLQVDVRIVPRVSFGAALLYFTGSKAHNVKLRQLALGRRLKLNEYGVFRGTP